MEELGEIVTRRQKLSVTDEVELSEEMWLEELEETPSDLGELEDLICDPMKVPPIISHHFSILHVLDLSYTEIKSLPQSISRLVALQKLFLRSCEHLMELPPEIGELTNLEVLDLEGTEILCLPKEIAKLVNLTCLKVSFYGYASQTVQKVIPRRVLSNLSRLIELIIDVSPYGEWWDVEVEAIIDDLRSLKQLETLKLYLPTTILLEELKCMFPGLPNFRFTVGRHEEHFISRLPHGVEEEFNNLEKGLKYMNGSHIPNEITKVFKPNGFFLQRHWTAKSLSDFGHENINEVKFCLVMECNEFRTIIDYEQFYQGKDAIVLGSLERLIIRYLKNVECIWKGPVGKGSLSNLKSLVVFTCPNLTTLLTIDMLGNLSNLEELIVEDCPKIEIVVSLKSSGSKSDLFLPSLKKISLIDVPELVSISGGLWIAPKLERLIILYCPKLVKLCTTEVSSTELKVIKGDKEWWDALKWYESDLSTEHGDYLARLFIPLRRDGDLMAQLTEDEISGYGQGKVGSFNMRDCFSNFSEEELLEDIPSEELEETPSNAREDKIAAYDRGKVGGVPWTEDEHRLFLLGLEKLGKNDWCGISRSYVTSRTPTQVASHAQKYFIRLTNAIRGKRRSRLFDMVLEMDTDQPPLPGDQLLPLSQEFEPMEATSEEKVKEEAKETVAPSSEFPTAAPAFYPAFGPLRPLRFPVTFYHKALRPVPVIHKEPVNVDELEGMSQFTLGETESSHREPPSEEKKIDLRN